MAESWSVEAKAKQLCGCWKCVPQSEPTSGGCDREWAAMCIRAGLNRAAGICVEQADLALVASNMNSYQQGLLVGAEACERAIKEATK